jgi:hypothetical protein
VSSYKVLFVIVGCFAALCTALTIHDIIKQYGHEQFERGAWAIVQHHKYYGNYGSMYYRDRVFYSNDDPQDSVAVSMFLKPAERK